MAAGGIPHTGFSRAALAALAIAACVLATLPFWGASSTLRLFTEFACLLVLAQMWNLLAGYGGMISVGQQAYLGLGGYALFVLANHAGVDPFVAVPLAAVVALLAAIPLGKIAFRLRGGYFAIGTWVIAETLRLGMSNWALVGGGSGQSLLALRGVPRSTRESVTFWLALVMVVAATVLTYKLLRSRPGLALTAIRDNEVASASQGVDVAATRFYVYLAAAFGCGLAGALYYLGTLRVSPDSAFSINWTAYLIFIVVVGGIGTLEGPIIGTLVFFALRELLADFGTWYLIALGSVAIVVMLVMPQGIWGWVAARYDLHVFPVRRRLYDQSGADAHD
jgi:branched-chain amino acid transport system permease protein